MNGADRVRIPWKHRWRRFRHGTLPLVGFAAVTAATLYLWQGQGPQPQTIGEVESIRVDVTASGDGILAPLPEGQWSLFDEVEANQVVAQLDDAPVRAELVTLQEDLGRLRKEFEAAAAQLTTSEADRSRDHLGESLRLQVEVETRRLAVLDRRMQVEADSLELERNNIQVSCLAPLYAKKLVSEMEMNNQRMLRDEVSRRLAASRKTLTEAEDQQRGAEQRLKGYPGLVPADRVKELAAFEAAVKVQESRIEQLRASIARLAIRAPMHGVICSIERWPGANVRAGDPILTIAANSGRYIVSYLRQEQRIQPSLGMPVDVRLRAAATSPAVRSTVQRVGPQFEPIPLHQCRDPKIPEWGLPVRIALPRELGARPGELLEVTFKTPSAHDG